MSDDSKRIELPKTLQERMLKFFLKAEAQRRHAETKIESGKSERPQNPINTNDRRNN